MIVNPSIDNNELTMSLVSSKRRYNVVNTSSENMLLCEPFELLSNKFITDTNNYSSLINIFSDAFLTLPEPDLNIVSSEGEDSIEDQAPLLLPPKEKQRISKNSSNKFRPYQAERWQERFDELIIFRKEQGHCFVPHTYHFNAALARWVKRQRYQYKLLKDGKQASISPDRIKSLEEIGFAWDSHEAAWQERLTELIAFKAKNGNRLVPPNYPAQPQLATWVKCQRRQYKLYWKGRPSNCSVERIMILEQHGFEWELRSSSYSKKSGEQDAKAPNIFLSQVEADGEYGLLMDLLSDS